MSAWPKIKTELKNFINEEDGMSPKAKIIVSGMLISVLTKAEFASAHTNHGSATGSAHASHGGDAANHGNCATQPYSTSQNTHSSTSCARHGSAHGSWSHGSSNGGCHASAGARHGSAHGSAGSAISKSGTTLHGNHDHCSDEHGSSGSPAYARHGSGHGSNP